MQLFKSELLEMFRYVALILDNDYSVKSDDWLWRHLRRFFELQHIQAKETEHVPYQIFQNEKKPLSMTEEKKQDTLLNYLHKRHI